MFQSQDNCFVEHMVRQQRTGLQTFGMVMTYIAGFLLTLVVAWVGLSGILYPLIGPMAVFAQTILLFLAVGCGWLTIRLGGDFHREYEYILTSGEIDVDCIVAKRKRTRLITFKIASAEKGGRYEPEKLAHEQFDKQIFACDDKRNPDNRYLVVQNSDKGRTLVVFTPDERFMKAMMPYLPRYFSRDFLN